MLHHGAHTGKHFCPEAEGRELWVSLYHVFHGKEQAGQGKQVWDWVVRVIPVDLGAQGLYLAALHLAL